MSKGEDNFLRYDRMVERALRGVVFDALSEVQKDGLKGDHHFYITFATDHKGVNIPSYLMERYPSEMTIVLQYQFYDMELTRDKFAVTLSFNNKPERLEIPLAAITIFADPSVNFALQFQPLEGAGGGETTPPKGDKPTKDKTKKEDASTTTAATGEVISLDQFRKK